MGWMTVLLQNVPRFFLQPSIQQAVLHAVFSQDGGGPIMGVTSAGSSRVDAYGPEPEDPGRKASETAMTAAAIASRRRALFRDDDIGASLLSAMVWRIRDRAETRSRIDRRHHRR